MSFTISTTKGDKNYLLYINHDGRRYGVRVLSMDFVSKPVNPNYLKKLKDGILSLEENGNTSEEINMVGTCESSSVDRKNISVKFKLSKVSDEDWVLPMDLIFTLDVPTEMHHKVPKGIIGLLLKCRISVLT